MDDLKRNALHRELVRLYKENFPHSTPEEIKEMNEIVSIVEAIRDSSPDFHSTIRKLLDLAPRAQAYGFGIEIDNTTRSFFISDLKTKTVIVPPPMNLSMVEEWLDDYHA